jgi:YegS/Rv2252/BmrU family lipid kinase
MSDTRRHLLLVNPSAGGGRVHELLPQVEAALGEAGVEYRIVSTRGVEHARREAGSAAEADEVPVVMSGDGLVGQVGGELAGTGVPMGIIPGGRGNDLARVLGIPTDPPGAAAVLAAGSTREIDVGEVNGRRFLGIASCGFDSDANRIANEARFVRGNLVYLYAALRALYAWKPATFTLLVDGERKQVTGYTVAVANNKAYGGGMYAAPNAELDDGLLDVVVCERTSRFTFVFRVLPRVFKGTHVELPYVHELRAREVMVSADRPFAMYADGDPVGDLPVTVRVRPGALTVLVP